MIIAPQLAYRDPASGWSAEITPPPFFAVAEYQAKINAIAGLTSQGEPVLRLVWGGSEVIHQAVKFDAEKNATEWRDVPRYAFLSKKSENFGQRVPIKRWIIEQNTDVGQLEAMGGKDEKTIGAKERGYYTWQIIVADHGFCRLDCGAAEAKCFGGYKEPDGAELQWIADATGWLKRNPIDHRKGVTPEMAARERIVESEDEKQHKEVLNNEEFIKDWAKTHGTNAYSFSQKESI